MSFSTKTTIHLGAMKLGGFDNLQIVQSIYNHHEFQLEFSQDWLGKSGDTLFTQVKDLIGMEVFIEIKPEKNSKKEQDLYFKGVITQVSTGKHGNSLHGHCTVKGYSTTIVLEDATHHKTFEEKSLYDIVKDKLQSYPQNLIKSSIKTEYKDTLEFMMQYKENTWQFIQRLANTFGEWCFFDGLQLVFGKFDTQEVTLLHNRDLDRFYLDMELKAGLQKIHAFEYRSDAPVEKDTKSEDLGNINHMSSHVLKTSDAFFFNNGIAKLNQPVNSQAKEQVRHFTQMERKSKVSQMVYARGESCNTGVQIGRLINIKEDFKTSADHGKYMVTSVTHVCNSIGSYKNFFTSIPSDTAAPVFAPDKYPICEAQSAIVVENNDPEGLGRVRVKFQWMKYGMTPWIRLMTTSGGADKGFYIVPEKGEEVWVDFEGGNPSLPYVVGSIYNGKAKTSFGTPDNDLKVIKTRSGHTIELNDAGGGTSITIIDKSGNRIFLDTKGKNITITAPNTISLNAKNIEFNADENMTVSIGADMKTTVGSNYSLKVSEKQEISAGNIAETVSGDKVIKIKGDLDIKTSLTKLVASDGDVTIKSAGIATLQGKTDAKVNKG